MTLPLIPSKGCSRKTTCQTPINPYTPTQHAARRMAYSRPLSATPDRAGTSSTHFSAHLSATLFNMPMDTLCTQVLRPKYEHSKLSDTLCTQVLRPVYELIASYRTLSARKCSILSMNIASYRTLSACKCSILSM